MRIVCRMNHIISLMLLTAVLLMPWRAFAGPILNFSDIDSGPKTGNTDSAGGLTSSQHGAIVTIWGNNLGSSQGVSKVYVGGVEAAHIYYWKDADGTLPGGPADLKTYHKMQEIAFSVPAGTADGSNSIKVTVGGADSNTLPFSVRSGNIKFIKTGGSNSNAGTWSSPLGVLGAANGQGALDGSSTTLAAGDIVYSVGVGTTHGVSIGRNNKVSGTPTAPISFIAYPNTTVSIDYTSADGGNAQAVVDNWYPSNRHNDYINLSKLKISAEQKTGSTSDVTNGIAVFKSNRIVGVEITGPTVYGGYGGAVTANGSGDWEGGGKYYGIYIHNYGTAYGSPTGVGSRTNNYVYNWDDTSWTSPSGCGYAPCSGGAEKISVDRFQHLFYISNRTGTRIDAYEIAWCHLANNPILHGIHLYDMGTGNGWNGTLSVHHNVLKNQRGQAIDASFSDSTPINVYNNLVVNDVGNPNPGPAFNLLANSASKIYNNTIYGYRFVNAISTSVSSDFRNNLLVDTFGVPFVYSQPTTQSNNLYFSTVSTPAPSWATASLNTDPLFTNAANGDFSLQSTSPAKSAGSNVTLSVAATDFLNNTRVSGSVSIGAFGVSNAIALPPAPGNIKGNWK